VPFISNSLILSVIIFVILSFPYTKFPKTSGDSEAIHVDVVPIPP
jgi:hypothetical protein